MTVMASEDLARLIHFHTAGGRKLHLVRPNGMTLCGFQAHQAVLVEEPLPEYAVCGWCRAASTKESS